MKLYELIAELVKYPAGADVTIAGQALKEARVIDRVSHEADISVVNIWFGGKDNG